MIEVGYSFVIGTLVIRFGIINFVVVIIIHFLRLQFLAGAMQLLCLFLKLSDIFARFVSSLTSFSRSSTLWTSLVKLPKFPFGIGGDFIVILLLIVPVFDVVAPFLLRTDFSNPPCFITLISDGLFYEVLVKVDASLKLSAEFAVLHDFFFHRVN